MICRISRMQLRFHAQVKWSLTEIWFMFLNSKTHCPPHRVLITWYICSFIDCNQRGLMHIDAPIKNPVDLSSFMRVIHKNTRISNLGQGFATCIFFRLFWRRINWSQCFITHNMRLAWWRCTMCNQKLNGCIMHKNKWNLRKFTHKRKSNRM